MTKGEREAYAKGLEEAAILVERFCTLEELRGCASQRKGIRDMAARGLVVAKAVRDGAAIKIREAAKIVRDDHHRIVSDPDKSAYLRKVMD